MAISTLMILLWLLLGTTSSVAWFQAEDTLVNNLHFGDLKVELYYKTRGEYEKVEETTPILSDEALYEPGYTQVVYLQIKNAGTVPFTYNMAIQPTDTVTATGVLGNIIDLSDYICFGLVIRDTEEEVMQELSDREAAEKYATEEVGEYSTSERTLDVGGTHYAALIVHMPESVGNEANYRGDTPPSISLSFEAKANQLKNE